MTSPFDWLLMLYSPSLVGPLNRQKGGPLKRTPIFLGVVAPLGGSFLLLNPFLDFLPTLRAQETPGDVFQEL